MSIDDNPKYQRIIELWNTCNSTRSFCNKIMTEFHVTMSPYDFINASDHQVAVRVLSAMKARDAHAEKNGGVE